MGSAMSGATRAEGVFQKSEHLLHAVAQLKAGKLKLTGERAHVFARRGQQIHAAGGELFGLGLGKRAPGTYNDAILEPARERIKELTVINGGSREVKGAWTCNLKPSRQPMPFLDLRAHSRKVRCCAARAM